MSELPFKWTEKGTAIMGGHQYFIAMKMSEVVRCEISQLVEDVYRAGQSDRAAELRKLIGAKP